MNKKVKSMISYLMVLIFVMSMATFSNLVPEVNAATYSIGNMQSYIENGNIITIKSGTQEVKLETCTSKTFRVQLSVDGTYRGNDPLYYMVQKNSWLPVTKTISDKGTYIEIKTSDIEIRINKEPLRISIYDLNGNLLSKDDDTQGMYYTDDGVRGVKKVEGTKNAGGIFGFGTSDHGRTTTFNRYSQDYTDFSMNHGKIIAPFFMSTVGYGIFLNTIETNTKFFKQGGGFETGKYLDYYFMYGPDFKTILNEYAEITGRMELYGKWAQGFMLSKYGNDNATQAEFLQWLNRFRNEDYPIDSYVFDYGWRQNGEKWGAHNWDTSGRYPDLNYMFSEARRLGYRVGLHNNKGTPEAANGRLWIEANNKVWTDAHMKNVIEPGYGDWFWPDEFDIPEGSTVFNYMPTFSAKGPYEAWKAYTEESRPMFVTRGSYAGQHFATAWSGDINNTIDEMGQQIAYHLTSGMIGYWATSNDLGGFMSKPSNELYTRWTTEFGAWNAIMRTHGHNGREPWLYDSVAQNTLRNNLKIRYALYPYSYSLAWQGYSQGTPIMRPMLLEDNSQYNSSAWTLNRQYYYGDWFLVAPALDTKDTVVKVWLPPNTTWYNYYTGARYEGGSSGKTISVSAALDEIPVFVKSGAIVPMGPDVNYADEKPLNPLTIDIYPKGNTTFTLFEDDGLSRKYMTENAYSTTKYESTQNGKDISFKINPRQDNNPTVYKPVSRSYNLKFNHIALVNGVTINGRTISSVSNVTAYNSATEAFWLDSSKNIVYVKTPDTGNEINVVLNSDGIKEPELGDEEADIPLTSIYDGTVYELENATKTNVSVDTEWKGYTGTGFAKGFQQSTSAVELPVNVKQSGTYDLVIRVNNGKKNDNTDKSARTGGMYLNGTKIYDLAFEVTSVWGETVSSVKQGIWVNYTIPGVKLDEGKNIIKIAVEGSNPGNFNLDSLTFNLKTTNAFSRIEAESAAELSGAIVANDSNCSNNSKITLKSGDWAKFADVNGEKKNAVKIRVKSITGGQIYVQENGVGDKVLSIINLIGDGVWRTMTVDSLDTDAKLSDIFLELRGTGVECEIDCFEFITSKSTVNPYATIKSQTAATRFGIDTSSKTVSGERIEFINHIENSDWALYKDLDFGKLGCDSIKVRYAAGLKNGKIEVRLDSIGGKKIAEINTTKTTDWNTFAYASAACEKVTGIHNIYLLFVDTNSATSICDFASLIFTERNDPTVNTIKITPESISLMPGMSEKFIGNIMGSDGFNNSVTWGISGQKDPGTTISQDGLLKISKDEVSKGIIVTLTSQADDSMWIAANVIIEPSGIILSNESYDPVSGKVLADIKNIWSESKDICFIIASYDEKGVLTDSKVDNFILDSNGQKPINSTIGKEQYMVKIFVWNSKYAPYMESKTIYNK